MCLYSRVRWVVEFLTQDYKITIMLSKKLMEFKEIIVFYEIVFGLLKIGQNSRKGFVHKFDKILAFLTTCVDIFFGMYKHRHFWTTYLPRLANVVCERSLRLDTSMHYICKCFLYNSEVFFFMFGIVILTSNLHLF